MNDSLADRSVFTEYVVFMVSAHTATHLFGGNHERDNSSDERDHHIHGAVESAGAARPVG
jgi:hypothetical protein